MLNIALFEPEIPPNTGNIIRLCANAGFTLHLIHPLGFELNNKQCRRAGLDYREWVNVQEHENIDSFLAAVNPNRVFACSTKGTVNYNEPEFKTGDSLLFGPETRGLPQSVLESITPAHIIRIPMLPESRSLNLSNATAIISYEAWRQLGFASQT